MNPRNEGLVFSRDAWWVSQERNNIGHLENEMRPAGFYPLQRTL